MNNVEQVKAIAEESLVIEIAEEVVADEVVMLLTCHHPDIA